MHPFTVRGDVWNVVTVDPSDPRLIDRTGMRTVATTDPRTRTVNVSAALAPPLLDRVMLHEVAHAVSVSHGLLDELGTLVPYRWRVSVEEWSARLMEGHGIEAVALASETLGRPVCIDGLCGGKI